MTFNIEYYMTLCIAKKKSRKCILKIMYNITKIYSLFFYSSYIMHWKLQTYRVPMSVYSSFLDIMTDIKDSKL